MPSFTILAVTGLDWFEISAPKRRLAASRGLSGGRHMNKTKINHNLRPRSLDDRRSYQGGSSDNDLKNDRARGDTVIRRRRAYALVAGLGEA